MRPTRSLSSVATATWVVMAVAAAATLAGLGNHFAYDDVPIIVDDLRIHTLSSLPTVFSRPYWPEPHSMLWRPWTIAGFTLQWVAGAGRPIVFHLVNLLLASACTGLLLAVYRRFLSLPRAVAGALLFAVLPVHSEVTANVVGQAELWCTLFLLAAVWLLLAPDAEATAGRRPALIALAVCAAAMAKEQGFTAPGLLIAAEYLRPEGRRSWAAIQRDLVLPTAALASLFIGRFLLLGGMGGGDAVPALAGLSAMHRISTMLDLFPRIVGTVVWPTRLLADYNPGDVRLPSDPNAAPLLGVALLLGIIGVCLLPPHRRQALALLGFATAALAPVANVFYAAGIIFAERHLYLPSAALCALPVLLLPETRFPVVRTLFATALVVAVALGLRKNAERQPDWRDTKTLFASLVKDAPRNYRGLMLYAQQLRGSAPDSAEALLRVAMGQFDGDAGVHEELGQLIRRREGCAAALVFFQRAVALQPERETARVRAAECSKHLPQEMPRTGITIHRPTAPSDSATPQAADTTKLAPRESTPPPPATPAKPATPTQAQQTPFFIP